MNQVAATTTEEDVALNEKTEIWFEDESEESQINPVVESAEFAYHKTNLVHIDDEGVKMAAKHIHEKLRVESYSPRTWRSHPLHICPPEPYSATEPLTKACLDWIFLISALNFSFWSERDGQPDRYGVLWQESWDSPEPKLWTGYWSLVASLNRALQAKIPITDPSFYSSETLCPDSVIEEVFRAADGCTESVPLLEERIAVMREVGFILCHGFGGSFQGFLDEFQRQYNGRGTALQLVQKVTDTFPPSGTKVCLWKRAQILVAETWAAFYPAIAENPHPIFPGPAGPAIHQLTMFADYRVPQILHHLRNIVVPALATAASFAPGRCSRRPSLLSSVCVPRCWSFQALEDPAESAVSSVLIDFYLWDLAKKDMVPTHRTRSIWY
ncbi:hypothetical protein C8R46DRAFT_1163037 [Mycena filopes]|nr:hypothetical protein C8R46DRAFT_1163037 [Mycena filopes]